MHPYRQCKPFLAGRGTLPGRVLLATLAALALLAFGTLTTPGRVFGASPKVSFISPTYSGVNNGNAEGPVGANVVVQGSGWVLGPVLLNLADSQDDAASGGQGKSCVSPTAPKISIPGLTSATADASGSFTAPSFQWPAAANKVGHAYWICGTQVGPQPGVSAYTVLSASPPSISISQTSVPLKSTVAVNGKNWLPGNQQITVSIVPCLQCDAPYHQDTNVTVNGDGTFSVNAQLPNEATAGDKEYVIAFNQSSDPSLPPALTVTDPAKAPQFTLVNQPTPTPSPSSSPTNTHTPVSTRVATGGGTSGGSSNGLLIVLLSALGVVLLLAAVVAVLIFVRIRKPVSPAAPPYGGPGGDYGQYSGSRRTGGPPAGYGQRGGWGGQGRQEDQREPIPDDSDAGDQPTINTNSPWR